MMDGDIVLLEKENQLCVSLFRCCLRVSNSVGKDYKYTSR
jgi:hypothetical protein